MLHFFRPTLYFWCSYSYYFFPLWIPSSRSWHFTLQHGMYKHYLNSKQLILTNVIQICAILSLDNYICVFCSYTMTERVCRNEMLSPHVLAFWLTEDQSLHDWIAKTSVLFYLWKCSPLKCRHTIFACLFVCSVQVSMAVHENQTNRDINDKAHGSFNKRKKKW